MAETFIPYSTASVVGALTNEAVAHIKQAKELIERAKSAAIANKDGASVLPLATHLSVTEAQATGFLYCVELAASQMAAVNDTNLANIDQGLIL